jgi:regulator of replication initiation timing
MTELQKVKQQNTTLIQNNLELAAENEALKNEIEMFDRLLKAAASSFIKTYYGIKFDWYKKYKDFIWLYDSAKIKMGVNKLEQ